MKNKNNSYPLASKIAGAIHNIMDTMTDDELEKLILECNGMISTNCSWIAYGIRTTLAQSADSILYTRKMTAEKFGELEA